MSNSEQCSIQIQLYLNSTLVTVSCELEPMTRYDFSEARRIDFEQFSTGHNFNFSSECGANNDQI